MRKGILGSVAALVSGAGLAFAQTPTLETTYQRPLGLPDNGTVTIAQPAQLPDAVSPSQSGPAAGGVTSVPTSTPDPVAVLCNPTALACCCRPEQKEPRRWFAVEYVMEFKKDMPVPLPLLTVGPTGAGAGGAFGAPSTGVVYGNRGVNFELESGIEVRWGSWLNEAETVGMESVTRLVEHSSKGMSAPELAPLTSEVLARPFLDARAGAGAALPVASPGTLAGAAAVQASTRFDSSDNYFLFNVFRGEIARATLIAGFRYLTLDESLEVSSLSGVQAAGAASFRGVPLPVGAGLAVADRADTSNHIYAGTIGMTGTVDLTDRFDLTVVGKVGMGVSHQVVYLNGATWAFLPGGGALQSPGGVLNTASNLGRFSNDSFVVLPEVSATFGINVTRWLRLYAGYGFLYVSSVARPGEQFDPVVNPGLVPASPAFGTAGGPLRPLRTAAKTDFYTQSVSLGFEVKF